MRRNRAEKRRHEGAGVVLITAGLILTLSFLPKATGLAALLGNWQQTALGAAAPAIPIMLFVLGLVLVVAHGRARMSRRVVGFVLGALTAMAAWHARIPAGREFAAAREGEGTGSAGAALVWTARFLLGDAGLWLLLALGASGTILLVFGIPAARVIRGIAWMLRRAWGLSRRVGTAAAGWITRTVRTAAPVIRRWARIAAASVVDGAGRAQAAVTRWIATRRAALAVPALEAAGHAPTPETPRGGPSVGEVPGPTETREPAEPAAIGALAGAGPAATGGLDLQDVAAPSDATGSPPESGVRRRGTRSAGGGRPHIHQDSLLPEAAVEYQLPPLALLGDLPQARRAGRWDPSETARALEETLASFGVEVRVVHWEQGPVVTRFEVQPAPGVKVQKVTSLTNDIALNLAAPSVRIEAPIPGKSAIGIEIPNQKSSLVHLKEILAAEVKGLAAEPGAALTGSLVVALGKDIAGHPIVADLTEMPHLLIAGATGSGKSVMLNAIIAGLLVRYTPHQVRFVMIDPKRIELNNYNNIPHLLMPVVTNPRAAAGALKEMLRVMEERFDLFARSGVRNIQAYNTLPEVEALSFIVIVIDELADLMMVAPADFEDVIVRLAQMTRATGIHLVVATQRPSVDVITGLIKANIPSRIAFAVSSQVDSRTIIDSPGAEKLLGRGDMLFLPIGASRPVRAQGSFVADNEIQALVEWWRGQGRPDFDQTLIAAGNQGAAGAVEESERLTEAARLIVRSGYGSVSLLQRKMRIGYVTAARLIDQLEERGIVGPSQGSSPREVLVGVQELDTLLRRKDNDTAKFKDNDTGKFKDGDAGKLKDSDAGES